MPINLNDITNRYNEAFGYTAMKVLPRLQQLGFIAKNPFMNVNTYEKADASFADMIFKNTVTGDEYAFGIEEVEAGTPALPFLQTKNVNKKYIAPPLMVSFTRDKHVVKTEIDRSNNVVLENFGNKPYEMHFDGILIDTVEHHYPADLMKIAHELFEAPGTYQVIGDIFDDLNIMEIFFNGGFNIGFVEGYVDTIKFSVNAIAVESAEFLLR